MASKKTQATATLPGLPYLNTDGALTELALQQLKNPFNPADIVWKPTSVKSNKCIALAYADKRTYEERLDLVFGIQNWSVEITKVVSSPYHIVKKARHKDWKDPNSEITEPEQIIDGTRLMVVVRVSVNGMGFKESSGTTESEDENSITTAEAQAFKRACSLYHVGKYLYWLPRYEDCDYSYGKIKNPPSLPDWAIPSIFCEDCSGKILTTEFKNPKDDTVNSWNPIEITKRSQSHFSKNLCMDCMRTRREKTVSAEANKRVQTAAPETQAEVVQAA
jgi:hypothetical protein